MKTRDIVLIGLLSALTTSSKFLLSFLPNIEIISLLFIIYTLVFGRRLSLIVALVFSSFEILIYGFSSWLLAYYLVWPLLILASSLLSKFFQSEYAYAILAAIFGYLFGLFFALIESLFYGWAYGLSYWLSGLAFDLIHGSSNFIIVLVLFKPLKNNLTRLRDLYKKN